MQPQLDPPGGGNAVAAWMLQALRDEYELELLCWRRPNLALINETFGTELRPGDFSVRLVPGQFDQLTAHLGLYAEMLRMVIMCRHAMRFVADFDAVVSANNEVNVGRRMIQYVHYPRFMLPRPDDDLRWYNRYQWAQSLYYGFCSLAAGLDASHASKNLTLVNSCYIKRLTDSSLDIDATVLYPPAHIETFDIPFEQRTDSVVCVGRIAPSKRLPDIIEVVGRIREKGHLLRLHIVGNSDHNEHGDYIRDVSARCEWITLHLDLPRDDLAQLLSSCRYGIHGMRGEHFGMAVAEMQQAGCLVFAPDLGGCAEIVANPALTFADSDEAVEKFEAVLTCAEHRERAYLQQREMSGRFTAEGFCSKFRRIVKHFVDEELASSTQ